MFRKLRLKLMFVNLSVIVLLFFLLITGTYFFVQNQMIEGGERMMHRISHDLMTGKLIHFPPEHEFDSEQEPEHDGPPRPMISFIKVNLAGDVVQTSPFISLTKNQLSRFVLQLQEKAQSRGSLIFDKIEYHYLITPIADNQGIFIVFQDFQRDRNLLKELVTGLSITGIICMFLSIFGSLFMANKAMVPIQRSWQQQKEFLADASHEFRTPLAIIQTNLEIVRDNPGETVLSQEHWLNNIFEETLCMTKLVESLLFLARADSHQQLLNKVQFPLNQTILIAAELFRPVANMQGITLELQVNSPIPYCGDEAKLRQVVGILLDNAIRHTPTGGKVAISLEISQQGILLTVTDTGEGINPKHLEKIFERFYQSDSSRSKGGTGLGLAIAKWIVESHKGKISALSTPGGGSVFTVLLPYV